MYLLFRRAFPALVPAFFLALLVWPGQAAAAANLFTVKDVHVDATAASSTEAMNTAIAEGRPRAFQILYRRLTRQEDWGRQPVLDPTALLRLSRGFSAANERRSTTRYVADIDFVFSPGAVARFLRANAIAYTNTASPPVLVIPMAPDVSHGPWAEALSDPRLPHALVPFHVVSADEDAGLAGLDFNTANWSDVAPAALRAQVQLVALVQASYAAGNVNVNIRELAPDEAPAATSVQVPLMQTVGTTYPVAAQAAAAALGNLWKARSVINYSQHGRIVADMNISSLSQWGAVQDRLAQINNVTGVDVTAMDIRYARMAIGYQGTLEQLRDALTASGLLLTHRDGQWLLAPASG